MEEYTQDSPQLDELDVKNRVQNLMWTVSGDYGLDTEVDTASFEKSKYISLYDAIKQGAFARYFDKEAFGGYVVRKVYLGADSSVLMRLGQLCVDSAVWKKASKERIGVPDVRKKAFADALERDFFKLTHSYWGKIQASYYRYALYGMKTEERTQRVLDRILRIQDASDTMEVIRCLDEVYNDVCDKEFESRVGGPGKGSGGAGAGDAEFQLAGLSERGGQGKPGAAAYGFVPAADVPGGSADRPGEETDGGSSAG